VPTTLHQNMLVPTTLHHNMLSAMNKRQLCNNMKLARREGKEGLDDDDDDDDDNYTKT
jgi:hypothetical protein